MMYGKILMMDSTYTFDMLQTDILMIAFKSLQVPRQLPMVLMTFVVLMPASQWIYRVFYRWTNHFLGLFVVK